MRRFALLLAAFAALASRVDGQDVRQQGATLTLPTYSDSALWQGASGNLIAVIVAGISHAKSLGKTPADFGRYSANLVAEGWGPPNSGRAIPYVRALAFNFAGYPGSSVQISATSDTSATLRYRRTYLSFFGSTRKAFGVTVDEYDQMTAALLGSIARYLGLRATARFDGEWTTVAATGRGSAVPAAVFPSGTYVASFDESVLKEHPDLAGAWEITYMPNGHHVLRHNGAPFIEGEYEVSLDQIAFPRAETGAGGMPACSTSAAYQWIADARTKDIRFARLFDDCAPRVEWVTNVRLTKK